MRSWSDLEAEVRAAEGLGQKGDGGFVKVEQNVYHVGTVVSRQNHKNEATDSVNNF